MTERIPRYPATPPRLVQPHPEDEWTAGSILWAVIVFGMALPLEAYGLWYDRTHPGNRKKWTLTSNARPFGGFDSITGEPLDVPLGSVRRTALLLFLYWLIHHWTSTRGKY